jgi:hypothetical protein
MAQTDARDLYQTTNDTHKTQRLMPPAESETAIPANERQQTRVSDRAVSGIGRRNVYRMNVSFIND